MSNNTNSNIEIIDCDSLEDFWELISPVGNLFDRHHMFFRGQSDSSWSLTPRIFRKGSIESFGRWQGDNGFNTHLSQRQAEFQLLHSFLGHCDSRGLQIPSDSLDFRKYIDESSTWDLFSIDWPNEKLIYLAALAQHHGVPTRLLDVTSQPYVAAYFAASSALTNEDRAERISVSGILTGPRIVDFGLRTVKVPPSISINIPAQCGSFIMIPNSDELHKPFRYDVSIESIVSMDPPRPEIHAGGSAIVYKVTLPTKFVPRLLHRCSRFGYSAATMFPGFDGAARATKEDFMTMAWEMYSGLVRQTEAEPSP